ncbi:5-oxoprolinase subunit PxpA [Candidatus Atribacteria bacterium 1244-E10-H5-B2]|nr:MAG: 5-oxoprolinase subunit PxpA [Candidatus Atribacteria bacterium 1244-E10-H5-B2]
MSKVIDLNCDMGESFGNYKIGQDEEVIKYITSSNIACGFHAGDPNVMRYTVKLAKENNVAIGAHPGLPDLQGFGRRNMDITPEEAKNLIIYQIGALQAIAKSEGLNLQHVKPHGALYHMVASDKKLGQAVAEAILEIDKDLILVCLAGSEIIDIALKSGLRVAREGFADRAYNSDGSLVKRSITGAVISDPDIIARRVIKMIDQQKVETADGKTIDLQIDTICLHGDNKNALNVVRAMRKILTKEKIKIVPLKYFIS